MRVPKAKWKRHCTYNWMLGLISFTLEVEVMVDRMVATLVKASQDDLQIELSPSLLGYSKRRFFDCYTDHQHLSIVQ